MKDFKYYKKTISKLQEGGILKFGNNPISSTFEKAYWDKSEIQNMTNQKKFLDDWYQNRIVYPSYGIPTKLKNQNLKINPVITKKNLSQNVFGLQKGNEVYFNKNQNYNTSTVPVHEFNHVAQNELLTDLEKHEYINNAVDRSLNKSNFNSNHKQYKYFTNPSEIHSGLMEFRYLNKLKPDQKINNENLKNSQFPKNSILNQISEKELIDLLNNTASNTKLKNTDSLG